MLTKSNSAQKNWHLKNDITPTALKSHATGYSNIFTFAHVAPLIWIRHNGFHGAGPVSADPRTRDQIPTIERADEYHVFQRYSVQGDIGPGRFLT